MGYKSRFKEDSFIKEGFENYESGKTLFKVSLGGSKIIRFVSAYLNDDDSIVQIDNPSFESFLRKSGVSVEYKGVPLPKWGDFVNPIIYTMLGKKFNVIEDNIGFMKVFNYLMNGVDLFLKKFPNLDKKTVIQATKDNMKRSNSSLSSKDSIDYYFKRLEEYYKMGRGM